MRTANFISVVSVVTFLAAVVFEVAMTFRRRRLWKAIEEDRARFLAERLVEKNYLAMNGEDTIQKVERLLQDLDQEWYAEHQSAPPVTWQDRLVSFLGNVDPRIRQA